jgi:hypothetical protein
MPGGGTDVPKLQLFRDKWMDGQMSWRCEFHDENGKMLFHGVADTVGDAVNLVLSKAAEAGCELLPLVQ